MDTIDPSEFETWSDNQLHEILRANTEFTEAVVLAIPELAADNAFELYGGEWLARYWRRLVDEFKTGMSSDAALKWAVNASAGAIAAMIAQHFKLPPAAIPASVAMAILIIRTAQAESAAREQDPPAEK